MVGVNQSVVGRSALVLVLALATVLAPQVLEAQRAPAADAAAPDLDIRRHTTFHAPGLPTARQVEILEALSHEVHDLQVDWSDLTGAPRRLLSTTSPLTQPAPGRASDIAMSFLSANRDLFLLEVRDLADTRFAREFVSKHNGVTHLTIQQQAHGIDVFRGALRVNVLANGSILTVAGEPIPDLLGSITHASPAITAGHALRLAAESAGVEIRGDLSPLSEPEGPARRYAFAKGESFSRDVPVNLLYYPTGPGDVRLVWEVSVWDGGSPNVYRTFVDAVSGEILRRENTTQYDHIDAHGPVYTGDSPVLFTPLETQAGPVARDDMDFTGWEFFSHDDPHADWWNGSGEANRQATRSNNVRAKQDRDGDNDDSEGFVSVGADEDFTFPVDLTMDPSTYTNFAIVNLFYWNNRAHDLFYHLGFDEAAGNFQADNFGLGGSDGDPVEADAQDNRSGGDLCNANMNTPGDGSSPRMQMYQCDSGSPERDTDLSPQVIIHEYGHGVHSRLVPTSESQRMNEGWSDYFAVSFLGEPEDDLTLSYPVGVWSLFDGNGIRSAPYSTDQTIYTRTYANIVDSGRCSIRVCSNDDTTSCTQDSDCGAGNTCDNTSCSFNYECAPPETSIAQGTCVSQVHSTGEIFCNTLWMARANLVWKYGFETGTRTMDELVIDGMKMSPADPTFLDMRDAVLQADLANHAGANQCLLWDAYADMGQGYSAFTFGPEDINPVESFDTPSWCTPNIEVSGVADFGVVCDEDVAVHTFAVANTGTGDLKIKEIRFEGAAGDYDFDSLPELPAFIAEGSHLEFSVRLDPSAIGTLGATVRILSNDRDDREHDLDLTGEGGEPNIEVNADLDFGLVCDSESAEVQIFNTGACDLTVTDVDFLGACAEYEVTSGPDTPVTIAPGSQVSYTVTFTPSGPGFEACVLRIQSDDPDTAIIDLDATGTGGEGDIALSGSLNFGGIPVDDATEPHEGTRTLSIYNNGTCPLEIAGVIRSAGSTDFTVLTPPDFPLNLQPGSHIEVEVHFNPSAEGTVTADIQVTSDDPDSPVLVVQAMGKGLVPDISTLPNEILWGPTVVGCGEEEGFTIQNLGQAELIISDVTTSNPDFSVQVPALPIRLPAGGAVTLPVLFEPSTLARKIEGTLDLTSNDPDTPVLSVPLCGEGVDTGMRLLVVDPMGLAVPEITRIQLHSYGLQDNVNDHLTNLAPNQIDPPDSCQSLLFHWERTLTPTETVGLHGSHYDMRVTVKDKGQPETRRISFTLDACEYKEILLKVD